MPAITRANQQPCLQDTIIKKVKTKHMTMLPIHPIDIWQPVSNDKTALTKSLDLFKKQESLQPKDTWQSNSPKTKRIGYSQNRDSTLVNGKTLEILDHFNRKVRIRVWQSQRKGWQTEETPNPMDCRLRETLFSSLQFQQQQHYDALDIQQHQEQETQPIKKKQGKGNVSLKRCCGVSYIKESESMQKGVEHIYPPLSHLIIQASSEPTQPQEHQVSFINKLFNDLFLNGQYLVVTTFESHDEQVMREYLLDPSKRRSIVNGRVYLCRDVSDLWMFWLNNTFVCFHFQFHPDSLLDQSLDTHCDTDALRQRLAHFIEYSDVQLGINVRKSVSGLKSFLRTLCSYDQKERGGTESREERLRHSLQFMHEHLVNQVVESKLNINTCSLRMELYVPEHKWKAASQEVHRLLTLFIHHAKDRFQQMLIGHTNQRYSFTPAQINTPQTLSIRTIKVVSIKKVLNQTNFIIKHAIPQMESRLVFGDNVSKPIEQHLVSTTDEFLLSRFLGDLSAKRLQQFQTPLYLIATRDCFAFDLVVRESTVKSQGRLFTKREYFFDPDKVPVNFKHFQQQFPDYRVGVTTYSDFFSSEELLQIEKETYATELKCFNNHFLQMTAQTTGTGERVRRTKFFFGHRYMWTRVQLAEPYSEVGAGVRSDVSLPPLWTKQLVEDPLVQTGIMERDFINSVALNVYHDGKEGLAQHFDDALRFRQPIYSVRLFSDCRLSFGSQFYGFCNGAFTVPLPRGCVCVLEENSFAANGIKHCIRPCDMTGKSAAIILRQMHSSVVGQAHQFSKSLEMPLILSTLSYHPDSVPYHVQTKQEATQRLKEGMKVEGIIGD